MAQSEIIGEEPSGITAPVIEPPFPPHWKWNFVANFADVSFFSLGMALGSLTTIMPLFIRQLGGSTLLVGVIPAIVQTGWFLPPLFAAPYISRLGRKLPYILRMTLGERLPWLMLAAAAFFLARDYPTMMLFVAVILLAIVGLAGGITMPAWMDMLAHVTPLRMRGKLFGWSGALGGLLGVGGGLVAERVLASYAFPLNFTLCFTAAGICMAFSYAALAFIREPEHERGEAAPTIREYMRQLPVILRHDRDFSAFIVARVLSSLGTMAVALVSIYATEQRGLAESLAGAYTSWMLGSQVITTPIWGTIGDRYGHKGSLQFGLLCTSLAMVLSLFAATPAGFYAVFALLGASSGVQFTTTLNMVVEFAKPAERVTYIGLHGSLIAPAVMLAPLLGGWLAQAVGYAQLFMLAALCSFLALAVLTVMVRDPRHRQIAQLSNAGQGEV